MTEKKLGRKKEHRERTLRNLATSLVLYEKLVTTAAKAKAVTPIVERLISKAKGGSLAARREAKSLLFDPNAVAKLFEDMAKRQGDRSSGFVRQTKLGSRPGDGAPVVQLELLYTSIADIVQKQKLKKTKLAEPEQTEKETE